MKDKIINQLNLKREDLKVSEKYRDEDEIEYWVELTKDKEINYRGEYRTMPRESIVGKITVTKEEIEELKEEPEDIAIEQFLNNIKYYTHKAEQLERAME